MSNATTAVDGGRDSGSTMRWRVLDIVVLMAILPSIISGTAAWWWIGDLCVHFRMPYAIILSVLAVVLLALKRWRWLLSVCVVLGVNIGLLWPLFARPTPTTNASPSLRVMTANVYIGNQNPQPILKAVEQENPDVLLVMEVDQRWLSDLSSLKEKYPYSAVANRDAGFGSFGPFGLAVCSRLPMSDTSIHRLGTARVPVIRTLIEQEDQRWTLIAAHPFPPVSSSCAAARDTFLAELAELAASSPRPTLLLGDLNITRWSPHFCELLQVGGLRDSTRGFGYQPTWPDGFPVPVIPIDHVLVSDDVLVLDRQVGPSIASDHRPVIADVAVRSME